MITTLDCLLLLFCLGFSNVSFAAALPGSPARAPLTLVKIIRIAGVPISPYMDHMAVDVKGHRLFATTQARKSVSVFDLNTGRLTHEITGIGNPHAIVYRAGLNRIFIVDGGAGLVRIFDGSDYHPLGTVKLLLDADSMVYDPDSKMMFVTNGGADAKLNYSLISAINTTTGSHVGDVKFLTEGLEQMVIERHGPRLYVNVAGDKKAIGVVNRKTLAVLANWPIQEYVGKRIVNAPYASERQYISKNVPIALDEAHHRVFVGCRYTETTGAIAVFDTQTGKEMQTLPIGGWVDNMVYDPASRRIYASCGKDDGFGGIGAAYVFQELNPDHYRLLGKVRTGYMGKTALLVPSLNRYYVSVPHFHNPSAEILVYRVQ